MLENSHEKAATDGVFRDTQNDLYVTLSRDGAVYTVHDKFNGREMWELTEDEFRDYRQQLRKVSEHAMEFPVDVIASVLADYYDFQGREESYPYRDAMYALQVVRRRPQKSQN
jgi:hypothetical protein